MSNAWYIFGASGLGMETLDILNESIESDGSYDVFFLDDNTNIELVNETAVLSFSPELEGAVTIAIGEPAIRTKIFKKLLASKLKPKSIVSRSSFVSRYAKIGDGCIIAPMSSIQSAATVKDNVAVNTAAIIGHDVVVEESAVISSQVNLGGGVTVGRESYIGMGAIIKEGVKIGSKVIIGMGSVVYKDIPDGVIAIGNPARPLKKNIDKKVFG